jgi:hypothetical protein
VRRRFARKDESGLHEKLEVTSLPNGMVEAMTRYTSVWSRFRTQNGLRNSLQRRLDALRKDDEVPSRALALVCLERTTLTLCVDDGVDGRWQC